MNPDASLSFPSADIFGIIKEGDGIRMMLSFMGLTGISSPLPNYFSDYLARYPESSAALADFCAIFNHRIYVLFYNALKKYRFHMAIRHPDTLAKIASLSGSSTAKPLMANIGAYRMCAYSGALSTRRRSSRGLESVISDFFGGVQTSVIEWMERRVALPNPTALDGSAMLGINTTVGTEIIDYSGKFRVSIGPLRRENFESFMEDGENIAAARQIISLYSVDPLSFDIEIKLEALDLVPVILGETIAGLGRTSSLGECALGTKGEAYSVILNGRD
jgi:type VI secretion system protein ImpH